MDNVMRDVILAAREYGMFVDRGDPLNVDMAVGDFTKDSAWHELDLSAIVPEHAHGILFTVVTSLNVTNRTITFRRDGNVNVRNTSSLRIQVANIRLHADLTCPISEDRKIEYQIIAAAWTILNFTVKGWWF